MKPRRRRLLRAGIGGGVPAIPATAAYTLAMPSGATSSDLAGVTNTDPFAAGWISQTSYNSRMFPDASGVFQTYSSGTVARNSAGLWHQRENRLQLIKNNTMTGAGAGVLPTGWLETSGVPAGITRTINGTVILANGLTALDVTFSGTASAGGTYALQFGANADIGVRELKTCVPAAGGTGHAVGDIITLATTGGTVVFAPRVRVESVVGGGATGPIQTLSIVSGGSIRVDTSTPIAQASTTGAGTGATFAVTYGLMTAVSLSGYMQLVSGSLGRLDKASYCLNFVTNVNGQVGAQQDTDDRLLNRDTTLRRTQRSIAPTGPTAVLAKPSFQYTFTNGNTYNARIYIAMPMLEAVPSTESDASFPIPTTTTAILNRADVIQIIGGPLTLATAANCGLEIKTKNMTHNGLEHRRAVPILLKNSTDNLLYRDWDGAIATSANSAKTYKTWRTNYVQECQHAITWGGSSVVVASTASAQSKSAGGSVSGLTSLQIDADGCITELKVWNGKRETATYQSVSKQVVVYGATSGGVVGAAAAVDIGATACVVQRFREVDIGGMSANGLVRIDANDFAQFGGMSKDMLYYSNEVIGASGSPTSTVDPIPRYVTRYFDYLLRTRNIMVYPTRPAASASGGISSADKASGRVTSFTTASGQSFAGDYVIDASYEGDLMAASGISYIVGREDADTSVDVNGVQKDPQNGDKGSLNSETDSFGYSGSIFRSGSNVSWTTQLAIDPWSTAGDSTSDLLIGVQYDAEGTEGAADDTTQAYNFRMTLTKTAAIKQNFPSTAPTGYLPETYELLGRWFMACRNAGYTAVSEGTSATTTNYSLANLGIFNGIGGNAYFDLNNANGFSTDWIGSNWGAQFQAITGSGAQHYSEASNAERSTYWNALKNYLLGFWYYLQYDCLNEVAALSATISAGGAGYTVGDRIVMNVANTMYPVVAKVTTVSAGAVTGVQFIGGVLTRGNSAPSNPVSQLSTSGGGAGCTLTITWGSRVPSIFNTDALLYGLASDHYRDYCEEDFAGWMREMYLREGRRLTGVYKMLSSDVLPPIGGTVVGGTNTAGALSYAIDSHSHKRYAKQRSGVWYTENEGWVSRTRGGVNSYAPIPFEVLLPLRADCTNMFVTFCVSASHPAFGAERMELSHMALSESCGILAAQMALGSQPDVQDFDYTAFRTVGLARGLVLPQTN